jgi:hypothetical protein
MSKPPNYVLGSLFAIALLIGVQYPQIFGLVTFAASIVVFGRLEFDRNSHDLNFYVTGEVSNSFRRWVKTYAALEVIGRSVIISVLSILLFSGTDSGRIWLLAILFVMGVFVGRHFLGIVSRFTSVNVVRWGYVRFSILLGIPFSIFTGLVPGMSISEVTWSSLQALVREADIDKVAEIIFGSLQIVSQFIQWLLQGLLGTFLGTIVSLLISVNVLFGFVIVLYSLILFEMTKPGIPKTSGTE